MGQEHLPANLMMGKAAALVVIKIEGEENKVYTELVADMGKRLSMHVVRTCRVCTYMTSLFIRSEFVLRIYLFMLHI